VTVTLRRPVGIVLAVGANDLVHLEFHQLVNDAESDANAEREPALAAPASSPRAS